MEVEEEGDPCRRLVLRHRRYDGDVDLGVAGDTEREGEERRAERRGRRQRDRM